MTLLAKTYSLILVVALWEVVARTGLVSFFFLPPVSVVLTTFGADVANGSLLEAARLTVFRAFCGFAIAVAVGVTLGIAMARFKLVHWFFDPLVALGMSVPALTLSPAFNLRFGTVHESKS